MSSSLPVPHGRVRPKSVTVLGSTGSVGENTLRVIREHRGVFELRGLAAETNSGRMLEQIAEFRPRGVYLKDAASARAVRRAAVKRLKVYSGACGGAQAGHSNGNALRTAGECLREFTQSLDADILVAATCGVDALVSVLAALDAGKRVVLANKELLVVAGALVMSRLRQNPQASLIPVDSEHSAVFQCLQGQGAHAAERIWLTGSGGPLRRVAAREFNGLSKETVIRHPKWKMGRKISVDSATLMNKGLEMIEASWLFEMPVDKIDVLIHPEAVIHSLVEFRDGALLAQLGVTDMRLPIRYALGFPDRLPAPAALRLDLAQLAQLTFEVPDRKKFPCLDLAYAAARRSGSAPCVLSAADEVAVGAFLEDKISFVRIPKIIEKVLSKHAHRTDPGLAQLESIYQWAVAQTQAEL